MNDEIKEILDTKLYFDLEEEDYIKIKNCITNLQQENEYLNSEFNNMTDYAKDLEQENERLKKNKIKPDELVSLLNQELKKQRDDYKSRCEKINEILKESPDFNYSNDYIILKKKIEGILQGENNE